MRGDARADARDDCGEAAGYGAVPRSLPAISPEEIRAVSDRFSPDHPTRFEESAAALRFASPRNTVRFSRAMPAAVLA
jgi:hypothetical protein